MAHSGTAGSGRGPVVRSRGDFTKLAKALKLAPDIGLHFEALAIQRRQLPVALEIIAARSRERIDEAMQALDETRPSEETMLHHQVDPGFGSDRLQPLKRCWRIGPARNCQLGYHYGEAAIRKAGHRIGRRERSRVHRFLSRRAFRPSDHRPVPDLAPFSWIFSLLEKRFRSKDRYTNRDTNDRPSGRTRTGPVEPCPTRLCCLRRRLPVNACLPYRLQPVLRQNTNRDTNRYTIGVESGPIQANRV